MVKIGDRITGRLTGQVVPSTVIGIVTPELFIRMNKGGDLSKWNSLYPDWMSKSVIVSQFDEPTLSYNINEMLEQYESKSDEFLNKLKELPELYNLFMIKEYTYHKNTYGVMIVGYPIDDVITLEELCSESP